MRPKSYMRPVVDRNVVMRRMTVIFQRKTQQQKKKCSAFLSLLQ